MTLETSHFLDLNETDHALLFKGIQFPWQILSEIQKYLSKHLKPGIHGSVSPHAVLEGDIHIGEGTIVEPHVYMKGPIWIGKNCQIRQGAYLRGQVIAGNECVLGNSCEFKNCLLFNKANVPHFSYIGDSILGHAAHVGSGVTLSNFKVTPGHIQVEHAGKKIDTGLRKFGAILGDHAEVGCHSVLNPGSLIGRGSILYPGISWRGVCPPETIVKLKQEQTLVVQKK